MKEHLLKLAHSIMKEERWHEAIKLLTKDSSLLEKHWELLWNLGWCYFKLDRVDDARKYLRKAVKLAPESHVCKYGLGQIYLKKNQWRKAELILLEALQIKDSHATRIGLALAYLAQGKVAEAEKTHLDGIRLRPKRSETYESYAAFLSDVGREAEAVTMNRRAKELRRLN